MMATRQSMPSGKTDTRGAWATLWIMAMLAGAFIPLSGSVGGMQDGDGLLTALISTEKLTWYFWGQDRLLNFIPALAAPVTDLEWNLRAQIFLRAFFAFLAPAGILCFLTQSRRNLAIATILTNAVLMLALSRYGAFNLYVQHNPFGSSLVLTWLAFRCWQGEKWPLRLLALIALFLAYATNLALLFVAFPLIGLVFIAGTLPRRPMFLFGCANVLGLATALVHSKIFGEHDTQLGAAISLAAIKGGYLAVSREMNWPWLFLYAAIAAAVAFRKRLQGSWVALACMGGAVALIGILSLSAWAQLNGYNIRYYLAFVIFFVAVASLCLTRAFEAEIKRFGLTGWLTLALPVFAFFAGLAGVSSTPGELLTHPWREEAPVAARAAIEEKAPLIVGGFWDVWSTVYEANVYTSSQQFFGAAQRGHVLRERVRAAADKDGRIRALCFLPSPDECASYATQGLKTVIVFAGGPVSRVPSASGRPLIVLTLRFVDAGKALPAVADFGQPIMKAGDVKYTLEPAEPPVFNRTTKRVGLALRFRNEGAFTLTSYGDHPVNLGVRLANAAGVVENAEFMRVPIPVVPPGASRVVRFSVQATSLTGHSLSVVPVQEGVGWFDALGGQATLVGPFIMCSAQICNADGAVIPEIETKAN